MNESRGCSGLLLWPAPDPEAPGCASAAVSFSPLRLQELPILDSAQAKLIAARLLVLWNVVPEQGSRDQNANHNRNDKTTNPPVGAS